MKRGRTLLVLAILAAVVAALVLVDRGRPSTDERREARGRLAPGFDRAQVSALSITRAGRSLTLERNGDEWWIADPHVLAEPTAVDELLGELDFGQVERRIPHPDAKLRAELGLASPGLILRAGPVTFQIGHDAPDGNTLYVARSGDPDVLVVERRLRDVIDRSPEAWRSLRLTLVEPDQSHSFSVGEVALERQGAGWSLTRPLAARASAERVDALLAAIDHARARSATPGTRAGEGASVPIVIDGALQARIGGACAGHPDQVEVARADGLLLCFAQKDLAPISVGADALRERRLFPLALDEVQGFDLVREGSKLSLRRSAGAWRIVAPLDAAGSADDGAVRAWLTQLLALTASGHGPPGKTAVTVRVLTAGEVVAVDFSAPQAGRLRALRSGEGDALLLAAPSEALLDPPPVRFRERQVWSFRADDLTKLTVEEGQGSLALTRERRAPAPDLFVGPPDRTIDQAAAFAIVQALSDLRADRFEPAAPFTRFRRLWFAVGDEAPRELAISAPDETGCLGEAAHLPRFHLPEATCRILAASIVRKGLPAHP